MGRPRLGPGDLVIVVTVARRPLSGSVATSVLAGGAGALNIDGSRIASAPGDETTSHVQGQEAANTRNTLHKAWQGIEESYQTTGQKLGRWPANLVLGHLDGCRRSGTKKVRGSQLAHVCSGDASNGVFQPRPPAMKHGYTDADGMETVATWECAEGCPVRDLDAQSGVTTAGAAGKRGSGGFVGGYDGEYDVPYGDTGGASRYFKQVDG